MCLGGVWLVAATVQAKPHHASRPKPAAAAQPSEGQTNAASAAAPEHDSRDDTKGEGKFKPVVGPKKVDLGHQLEIDLPEGFLYLDPAQAAKFMESLGNLGNHDLLGVVAQPESSWIVTIRFTEDGYVKDDEAEKMDAEEILKAIREGTDEANQERAKKGFKALHVVGWSEPPRYARDRHHLIWGIRGQSEEQGAEEVVNFNTRVLGRAGFASLNLIDGAGNIEASKPSVAKLLAAIHYQPGARYEDFDSKKDKVAEYGLAALVVGGAGAAALKLVKIGLLAKFGGKLVALLIAFKKGIILLFIAAFAFIKRIFKGGGKKAAGAGSVAVTAPDLSVASPPLEARADGSPVEEHPAEGDPGGKKPA